MRVIVSGGGTGGHVYPALAIIEALKKKKPSLELLYIGTQRGIESEIVPAENHPFRTIEVRGFIRKLTLENIRRLYMAQKALKDCKSIMKEFRPDLVIGTGGYVCGPVLKAAHKYGAFCVIHEQNAYPGITNKLLSREMDLVFLGFEEAKERLKGSCPKIFVGNPVRRSIFDLSRQEARNKLGLSEDDKMLVSIGGSGGSESLNTAFAEMMPILLEKGIRFLHTTGKMHYEKFREAVTELVLGRNQEYKSYESNVPLYLAAADLVICSAGATTLAEVNAMGRAAIVIPKAYTAENHQEYNARAIKENGAGDYILEKDLNPRLLQEKIESILNDEALRYRMEECSRKMYPQDPAREIVQAMLEAYGNQKR